MKYKNMENYSEADLSTESWTKFSFPVIWMGWQNLPPRLYRDCHKEARVEMNALDALAPF